MVIVTDSGACSVAALTSESPDNFVLSSFTCPHAASPATINDTNKSANFRLFRGNGGLKTATTPVFIHAKRHSVFDLEVECVYQSIQGTPYRAYFVCF